MNLDLTYCKGEPCGISCPIKKFCKRWIGLYEVPENSCLWFFEGQIDNCSDYSPTEDLSE